MSRIAIVGPIHPLRGGIAQHTEGVVSEARARGHDVRVVSYRRQYPRVLFPGRTQIDDRSAPPEATSGVSASIDSLVPTTWWRAASEVRAFAPDIVVLQRWHPFFAPLLATIARRLRGEARIVWMVHNASPHEGGAPWGPLLTLGLSGGDVCVVHAAASEEALRALGVEAELRNVPMPAPREVARLEPWDARRRLGIGEQEVVYLFFGHVRRYKGVEVFLRALGGLAPEGPAVRAIVAGEWYVDRRPAERLVSAAGLQDRVWIDDRFLPEEAMREYFAAADVVVLPYLSGTQSAVVPLAYAHGRPVVTTRVGGLPEIVADGETGLLVPPGDVAALADALEAIRRGRTFRSSALAAAHASASYGGLVDELEAIVRAPVFP